MCVSFRLLYAVGSLGECLNDSNPRTRLRVGTPLTQTRQVTFTPYEGIKILEVSRACPEDWINLEQFTQGTWSSCFAFLSGYGLFGSDMASIISSKNIQSTSSLLFMHVLSPEGYSHVGIGSGGQPFPGKSNHI